MESKQSAESTAKNVNNSSFQSHDDLEIERPETINKIQV